MIVKINLLPWREELRLQEENKVKRFLTISCFVGVLLAGALVYIVNQELESRMLRHSVIDAELSQLGSVEKQMQERKTQKDKLNEQLTVLQKLSAQRSEVVGLMERFASVIPEDAFVISLAFTLENLSFNALAKDRDVLSVHLDKIDEHIGSPPIPPVNEVIIEGNKFISYSFSVKPRAKTNK